MKREWNQSADRLASTALQKEEGAHLTSDEDRQDLITLNRLDELLKPKVTDQVARRIVQAQNEEKWIADLKSYLQGNLADLTVEEAKACSKIADDYEVDADGLLVYCPTTAQSGGDRDLIARLVVPETLHRDFLHHYHTSLEGGHQGIGRTYQRIRAHFHWRGLYRSVQRYVGECIDCEKGKGRPVIRGPSPGNLQATYPFQIVAMDHITSLPKSFKGNTELLIWVDLFTGYVIAKASASRTAQTIAENYEECVFRRFGASEAIRHDREPGFMADFFRAFNRIVGQGQRATIAYRPQANGTADRMVQTLIRSVKMYVADTNQRDWDEYAERPTFALNTAQDRVRGDTPFYLAHGWDPRTTLEASLPFVSTRRRDRDPRRWRYHVQAHYQRAREQVRERLREAIRQRADEQNERASPHGIEAGSQVWPYLDRVKEGYARKLAHQWHGPFRVAEMVADDAAIIEIAGSEYRLFPIVHVSKLKLVRRFPDRPHVERVTDGVDRLDFDEALLPEDSWESTLAEDEFEVEQIVDVRSGRRTSDHHWITFCLDSGRFEDGGAVQNERTPLSPCLECGDLELQRVNQIERSFAGIFTGPLRLD
ncbi:unnamed protein product [Phytophthora fragariaefolia]|uniref:Unnamed protein product n=1 Tax=Phytophthora fragariaefolia TaxID=1490495 RepID=A0A9W6TUW8_9STRA|nr:unnamed protein product [Phytophthora fragariaefolia]